MDTLPESALELAAAFVCYWLFAGMIAWMKGWRPVGRRNMPMKEEAMITKNQLHAFSESFRKLSQSFEVDVSPRGALNDQEMQDIFNAVTEQVCKDCSRCSYCWENVFEDSCESAYEILKLCSERVNMKKKDLPERFRQRCVRSDNFLAEARRMMGLAQTNLSWQNRLAESRLALAGQFGEVADVIGEMCIRDSFRTAIDLKEVLIQAERAKEEVQRMQKRVEVLEAVVNDSLESAKDGMEVRWDEQKQRMALLTEERMTELARHMDALRKRLENSESIERIRAVYKRQVLRQHQTIVGDFL